MPHILAGVCVTFDTEPFHQRDVALHRLAKTVFAVGGHCHDRALDGVP
jgi:hypothetical protein